MKRLVTLAAAIVLVASFPSARAADDDKVGESPYYPLKVGNTWTYNGPKNSTIVNKVVAHEKVGGVMCAKIETYLNGQATAFASEHISITKDGIYRNSLNGKEADKPILILKLPPKTGDEWKIESKIGGDTVSGTLKTSEDKVKVDGKEYDAMVAGGKLESGNQTVTASNYFVKDMGVAKIKMEIGGETIEVDLAKFEPAK
jgi:hypothetical protein